MINNHKYKRSNNNKLKSQNLHQLKKLKNSMKLKLIKEMSF